MLTAARLAAGGAVALDIRGGADHTHTVELSGGEIVQIADGQRVSSGSNGAFGAGFGTHSHVVTFN